VDRAWSSYWIGAIRVGRAWAAKVTRLIVVVGLVMAVWAVPHA
jgi:hypothetical protein